MTEKIKIAFYTNLESVKKLELDNIDLNSKISDLKEKAAGLEQFSPNDLELVYCGRKLSDSATLSAVGLKPGVTVNVFKRSQSPPEKISANHMQPALITLSFEKFQKNPTRYASSVAKLSSPKVLKMLMDAVPALYEDPVAIAFIIDPVTIFRLANKEDAKKFTAAHPVLEEVAPHIISFIKQDMTSSSTAAPASNASLSFPLEDEDDDLDDASQESDTPQLEDELSSMARYFLNQPQNASGESSGGAGSSMIITPQMLGQAISAALASTGGQPSQQQSTSSNPAPAGLARERQMSQQLSQNLQQMNEFGLRDDVINIQALQACDMNVQDAINLILSGALSYAD